MSSKSEEQATIVKNSQPLTQEQNFDFSRGTDRQLALGPVLSINGEPNPT